MSERKSQERVIHVGERTIKLVCPICGCEEFYDRKTLLNTVGMTYLGLDWANDEATNYVCKDCSYILWFEKQKEKLENPSVERDILRELEEDFNSLSEKRLQKIISGRDYNATAKQAAGNVLKRRGIDI